MSLYRADIFEPDYVVVMAKGSTNDHIDVILCAKMYKGKKFYSVNYYRRKGDSPYWINAHGAGPMPIPFSRIDKDWSNCYYDSMTSEEFKEWFFIENL